MFKYKTQLLFTLLVLFGSLFIACRRKEEPIQPTVTAPVTEAQTTATPTRPKAPPVSPTAEVTEITYDWPPQLLLSKPQIGEEVALEGPITLRFDQPMDKASVKKAFRLNKVGESSVIEGTLQWPEPDTVSFTPHDQLERAEQYEILVDESAASLSGLSLIEPIRLQLDAVGKLDVTQVLPAPVTVNVQADAVITVMFNRPVVPLVGTGQQSSLPQPLKIEPSVDGQGEWVSTSIYRFTPDAPLAGATTYRLTVPAGLTDVTGGLLEEDFSWRFTTLRPGVVSTWPTNRSSMVDPTTPITVTFNMPMDRASTQAAISLEPTTTLNYSWSDGDRVLTLTPSRILELETDYALQISSSARSANGSATLDHSPTFEFRTVPFPAILSTRPGPGQITERFQRGIMIRFASPMDFDSLEDQILIEPEPAKTSYFFNDYDNSLFVDFDLQRNTQYEITVPGSAADPYGNILGEDYVWQFSARGYDPLVSMNLPRNVSQLSTSYPSQVELIYRNISQINANLFDVGLPVRDLVRMQTMDYSPPRGAIRSWTIPIDASQEQVFTRTLEIADGAVLPTGVYLIETSAPESIREHRYWQNQKNFLVIADTNLVVKEYFDRVYVWATELSSGLPVEGLNLTLFGYEGEQLGTAVTDVDGFANFPYRPAEDHLQGVLVSSNQPGEAGFGVGSSIWADTISPWDFGLEMAWSDEPERYVYLHTDRPIYRPGDTVHFRGVVRDTNYGRYPLPSEERISVGLEFITNYEQIEYAFESTLDENGEFSGEYQIPEDAQLGTYRLIVNDLNVNAYRDFNVAEYRKPEFQIAMTADSSEALRGQSVEVVVEADYFFGGPASELPLNWQIRERNYQFPWDGPYYSFGDNGHFFYESSGPFRLPFPEPFGNFLLSGEGQTNEEGEYIINLPADILDELGPGSREVIVEATIHDISNFPVTAKTEVVFHDSEYYVGVRPSDNIGNVGVPLETEFLAVDWESNPVPDADIEVAFYQRDWLPVREQEYGRYFTRWEVADTEVARTEIKTDQEGKASTEFVPESGGIFLAVATISDGEGRNQISSSTLYVLDPNFVAWRSDPKDSRMELTLDQQSYRPGETARILVQSPFDGPVQAWLTIERGGLLEQEMRTLESNSDIIEVPIDPRFAPNVFVSVHAVSGVDDLGRPAELRIGMIELEVSSEQLALDINLSPRSEKLQPGESAIYQIQVSDHLGNPVEAQLSLALVDLAVLTLQEDNAPDIVSAFYEKQPLRSQTGSGLIVTGEGLELEIPEEAPGFGGGGGGEAALAPPGILDEEDAARRDFPDTAFWNPSVMTDESGRATIEIPLPDSLTTWRLSSKGVSDYAASGETLVGQNSQDVVTTLPLLIRPVTPRFFTVGDKLELGAVVHNNTEIALETMVELKAEGLDLQGPAMQVVTIPPQDSQLVRWPVSVSDVTFADLTFIAESGELRDATKPTFGIPPEQHLPVVRFTGEDIVGTSGVLDGELRRVEAILLPPQVDERQSELIIQLNPSLAAALLDALEVVQKRNTSLACAHSISERLQPNSATALALQQLNIARTELLNELDSTIRSDISALEGLQHQSGGWGWCYSTKSDANLSANILLSLAIAQKAGFSVDEEVLDRGMNFLSARLKDVSDLTTRSGVNRQAFFLYVLAELGMAMPDMMDELFDKHRSLMDSYARALLAMAYEVSGGSTNQNSLLSDLNDEVILSATGAHWEDVEPDWNNLSSDIVATAISLDALSKLDPKNPLAPNAVRWLMVAREAGHWPTSREDAWSILALTDWMFASAELEADYEYQVDINGRNVLSGGFSEDNLTETQLKRFGVEQLQSEDVNFLDFQRTSGPGNMYYTTHLDSFIQAEDLAPVNRGFSIERAYFEAACDPEISKCEPISNIKAGEQVRVELTIVVPSDQVFVIVEDPLPSGAEAIDPGLATSSSSAGGDIQRIDEDYFYGYWGWWNFDRIEYRDEKVVFLSEYLPAGTYQYSYNLQPVIPGQYQVNPATARQEFFPEVFGRSSGFLFEIEG